MTAIDKLRNGMVVSCQAWPDSPLHGSVYMSAMAQAAAKGGAAGIRANGAEDIEAIRQKVPLPIIGIEKKNDLTGELWITPTFDEASNVANSGADIVAIDGRRVERPDGTDLPDLISRAHDELGIYVMVDVSTFDEGQRAQSFGADLVATTFAIQGRDTPDFDLLSQLLINLSIPVVAEGLFWTPEQVCEAFKRGAHSVVVGSAITRPDEITQRFVQAIAAGSD